MRRTIDDLRTALIPTWWWRRGAADEAADDPVTALLVRGWLVGLEEVALAWDPAVGVARSSPTR